MPIILRETPTYPEWGWGGCELVAGDCRIEKSCPYAELRAIFGRGYPVVGGGEGRVLVLQWAKCPGWGSIIYLQPTRICIHIKYISNTKTDDMRAD